MTNKPLVVIDTSVFISSLLSTNPHSAPNRIINHWRVGDFLLIMTPKIEAEIIFFNFITNYCL
jgi:predicted nucleic acid-binding protein